MGRCLALVLLALLQSACERQPPLPAALAKFDCQKDSKYRAPSGYVVARAAGVALALPCQRPGKWQDLDQHWKDPANVPSTSFAFKKRADGGFEVSDDASDDSRPSAARTRYTVNVSFGLTPFHAAPDYFRVIRVPTPAPFAATGPQTVFQCDSPERQPQARRLCWGRPALKPLHWNVEVRFGFPDPPDLDLEKEVAEAYALAAAHILTR